MIRPTVADPALLQRFRAVLGHRLGLHFEDHHDSWLSDTLRKLAAPADPEQLLDEIERRPDRSRLDQLASALTVGETFFFRHAEQFDALRLTVLPAWQRQVPAPRRLRALSAGCASGEEAYTLAITLQRAGLSALGIDWQVMGFDLNPAAVARAVAARYGAWSLRATPPGWRDLWFRQDGDAVTPLASLRERVRFEQRHIAQPDPAFWTPGAFDVIFCRNMLMYLDGAALAQAVRHLMLSLAPGGALFVGHAETLRDLAPELELRHADGCFFYQRRPPAGAARAGWPFDGEALAHPPGVRSPDSLVGMTAPSLLPSSAAAPGTQPQTQLIDEALLLIEAGQVDDGLRACARLMDAPATPARQAEIFFLQALALEERGELPAAEWNHQRAAARDAGFAMPHLRLGLLAQRRGEIVAARRELRRALELLDGESSERVRRFGGGFERDALRRLCQTRIGDPAWPTHSAAHPAAHPGRREQP